MDPSAVTVSTTVVVAVLLVVLLIVVLIVVAVVAASRRRSTKRAHLQERFGPEYDRAVADGGTRAGEKRLSQAEQERGRLDVRPLSAESRRRRTAQWQAVQADFVEVPVEAVDAADELVREVMEERGYPRQDGEEAIALLATDHADTVEHYRSAQAHRERFRGGEGSTEDLRRAFMEYRRLFDALVEDGAEQSQAADPDGSTRPDGSPMTADDYVRVQQARTGATDRPAGQHAARDEVDVRDDRDPAPAATPVSEGSVTARRPEERRPEER